MAVLDAIFKIANCFDSYFARPGEQSMSSRSLLPQVLSNRACKYMCSRCCVHRRQGKSFDTNTKGISASDIVSTKNSEKRPKNTNDLRKTPKIV